MPEKKYYEEEINEMLDTDFEWSRMTKDELELFLELIKDGALIEPMVKHQVKEKGGEKYEEMVEEWYPGKYAGRLV